MRLVLAAFLFSALPALAQQPSETYVKGFVNEIAQQRNSANDRAAQIAAALAEEQEKSKAKDAEIERLKKLCGDPCKEKK